MTKELNNTLCFIQMTNYLMVICNFHEWWHMEYESKKNTKYLWSGCSERCKAYEQDKTILGSDLLSDAQHFCLFEAEMFISNKLYSVNTWMLWYIVA